MRGLLVELKLVYGGLGSRTEGAGLGQFLGADRLRPASLKPGVGLGGLLVGLGLKLVSATRLRSHGWCWAAGLWCWLRLELRLAGLSCAWAGRWMGPGQFGLLSSWHSLRAVLDVRLVVGLRPVSDTLDTPDLGTLG